MISKRSAILRRTQVATTDGTGCATIDGAGNTVYNLVISVGNGIAEAQGATVWHELLHGWYCPAIVRPYELV